MLGFVQTSLENWSLNLVESAVNFSFISLQLVPLMTLTASWTV